MPLLSRIWFWSPFTLLPTQVVSRLIFCRALSELYASTYIKELNELIVEQTIEAQCDKTLLETSNMIKEEE